MSNFKNKLLLPSMFLATTINHFNNFFNDTKEDKEDKYDRSIKIHINERSAKLARENIYNYQLMDNLINKYPEFSDKELYDVADGISWGIPEGWFDKFYKNRNNP